MSADNGIYIGQWDDGFRVAYCHAIDNIDCEGLKKEYECALFGNSKVFATKQEAMQEAMRMEEEIMNSDFPILEYGISSIGHRGEWPKMSIKEARDALSAYWHKYETRG